MERQKGSITNFTIPLVMIILMSIPFSYLLFASWDKSWEFDYRKINPEIVDTLKMIDRYGMLANSVSGHNTSYLKSKHRQIIRQKWLLKNATTDDLLILINFPKDLIRAIAFEGLCQRNHPEVFNILIQLLNEKERTIWVDNYSIPTRLVEFCFERIMGYELPNLPPRPPLTRHLKILTDSQREFIFNELKKQKLNYSSTK